MSSLIFTGGYRSVCRRGLPAALALWALVFVLPTQVPAVNRSWDDGGADKNWNTAANWSGNTVPLFSDDVFIGDLAAAQFDIVLLDVNDTIASLTITNGADLRTNGSNLLVNGPTVLDEDVANVVLRVDAGVGPDQFDTEGLDVNAGAQVLLNGGILEIESGVFDVDQDSFLNGNGTVDFDESTAGKVFNFAGTLTVTGTMTLNSVGGGTLDLDGTSGGDSVINIQSGASTLVVNGTLSDAFSGTMNFLIDDTVNMVNGWTADSSSTINLNGGTIAGGTFTSAGPIVVDSNTGVITADMNKTSSTLTVNNGSDLQLDGTADFAAAATLSFTSGGGTFTVNGATTINQATYDMDSVITNVGSGGTLTINSSSLDPAGDGVDGTHNVDGTLIVDVQGANQWDLEGTVNLTSGRIDGDTLRVSNSAFDNNADVVAVSGTSNIDAFFQVYDGGDVTVNNGATLNLNASTRFESGADVTVNGTMANDFGVTFAGPNAIGGTGTIRNNGSWIITDDTTINTDSMDLDGNQGGGSITSINSGNTLVINSNVIETDLGNDFDGTINITSSTLEVNTAAAWQLDGVVSMFNNTLGTPTLNGSEVIVQNGGEIRVNGNPVDINADVTLETGGQIRNLTNGSFLILDGQVTFDGGDIVEDFPSTVRQDGGTEVTGTSSVNVTTYDWDQSTTTITPSGDFTLNVGMIDAGNDVYNNSLKISGGTLTVNNTAAEWEMASSLVMDSSGGVPTINGADLTISGTADVSGGGTAVLNATTTVTGTVNVSGNTRLDFGPTDAVNEGTIRGNGLLTGKQINNRGLIAAGGGGTLTIDLDENPDLDGSLGLGPGALEAIGGNLTVVDPVTDMFDGTATIAGPPSMTFQGGWTASGILNLNGTAIFTNRPFLAGGTSVLDASNTTNVDLQAEISAPVRFLSGTTVNLPDADDLLYLTGNASVEASASFNGLGTLINRPGSTLFAEDGASIDVIFQNQGVFEPGNTPGDVTLQEFEHTASGATNIELGGLLPGNDPGYDQINVVGVADLFGGTLNVSLIGVFNPGLGSTFDVLNAAGGISGTYDDPVFLPNLDPGLGWLVDYGAKTLTLEVVNALLGDLDCDGDIDFDDIDDFVFGLNNPAGYTAVYGVPPNQKGDTDLDGDLDFDDIDDFVAILQAPLQGAGLHGVPEPSTGLLMVLAGVGLVLFGRRARS